MENKKDKFALANKPRLCRGCNSLKTGLWLDFRRIRLDKRTKLAKTISFLKKSLRAHLGGECSIVQEILIDRAVHKLVKVMLYENGVIANPDQGSRDYYIALANSLRLDLQALGIEGKQKDLVTLPEYIKQKEKPAKEPDAMRRTDK